MAVAPVAERHVFAVTFGTSLYLVEASDAYRARDEIVMRLSRAGERRGLVPPRPADLMVRRATEADIALGRQMFPKNKNHGVIPAP